MREVLPTVKALAQDIKPKVRSAIVALQFATFFLPTCTTYAGLKGDMLPLPGEINGLRVELPFKLPIDPIRIRTMADYDLTLAIHSALFTFDASRRPIPAVIDSWEYLRDASALGLVPQLVETLS